ncbi:MAG: tyrosine-type recombinase/integrase [Anaerolineaceae bacterium]|nr:tyrosine-type recombinase/integrase [Anaerolineaceae bacterium]
MDAPSATTASLAPPSPNRAFLQPHPNRNHRHRLRKFVSWLDAEQQLWYRADLAHYRDYLLHECHFAASSVSTHLATVRSRYQDLLGENTLRDSLFRAIELNQANGANRPNLSPADRKALVDEALLRIQNNINPRRARIRQQTLQDRSDDEHLRLTAAQSRQLLRAPAQRFQSKAPLRARRDHAIIALMLCTGLREGEICNLLLDDLYQQLEGEEACRVRHGKGNKQRLVPYGALIWGLDAVDHWLEEARIERGHVFRGFYRGSRRIRPGRLSESSIQRLLRQYPISLQGRSVIVRPHDLRRTYARRLFEAGMKLAAIQQNLGHEKAETTLGYIGQLGVAQRLPLPAYDNP